MGGLFGEEISKIRQIYSAVPQEWKNNVKLLRKAIHLGLNLNSLFCNKIFRFEEITLKNGI